MNRLILAQESMDRKMEMFRSMGSRFEQTDPNLYWKLPAVILMFVAAGFLLWVLYRMQRRRQEKEASPQPRRLFLRTMRLLGLAGPDIWQLWRLAKRLQLRHPTALLISPLYFDHAVSEDCADVEGKTIHTARRHRLMAVRRTLFGTDAPS